MMSRAARYQPPSSNLLTLGEAAAELGVQKRLLRSWDDVFGLFAPNVPFGPKRLYGPLDMAAARALKRLLLVEDYAPEAVVELIGEVGAPAVIEIYGLAPERADPTNPAHRLQHAVLSAAAAGYFGDVLAEVSHPAPGRPDGDIGVASYAHARLQRLPK